LIEKNRKNKNIKIRFVPYMTTFSLNIEYIEKIKI